jgi:hypothetical protein
VDEDDLLPPASMEDLDEYLDMLYQVGTGEERGGEESGEGRAGEERGGEDRRGEGRAEEGRRGEADLAALLMLLYPDVL